MPTAARSGGFQERKVDDMPCWGKTTTLLPLFKMYHPKLPPLALACGCTSLTFMQVAQADVVVVEKLSDMDFVKSSNHMVPGRKCYSSSLFFFSFLFLLLLLLFLFLFL
jgi:hypothetical protein